MSIVYSDGFFQLFLCNLYTGNISARKAVFCIFHFSLDGAGKSSYIITMRMKSLLLTNRKS